MGKKEAKKKFIEAKERLNKSKGEKEKIEANFQVKRARAIFSIAEKEILKNILKKKKMSKYIGPRFRIIRRLGEIPSYSTKNGKRNTRPGQHGSTRKKRTQFSYRIEEKKKIMYHYGVSEKNIKGYIEKARKEKGNVGK